MALWGFGREGQATLRWLRQRLPDLSLTVLNDTPSPSDIDIAPDPNLRFLTGARALNAISSFDIIIKSPGVSLYRPEVRDARAKGVRFTSATQIWFDEHPQVRTVCITGSKGKSTTASLVFELLRHSGANVMLGGNIGLPLLDQTAAHPPPETMVIELSSYQTSDLRARPSVALLLNLFPEHLDWHGDVDAYYRDKLHLFDYISDQSIIINHADPNTRQFRHRWPRAHRFNHPDGFHIANHTICRGLDPLLDISQVRLLGFHNLSNICAALTVMAVLGVDPDECLEVLANFKGLPHRMQIVEEKEGVLYVDDSISTAPEAAIAAIQSFEGRPITLLAGGFDRGLPLQQLATFLVNQRVHAVVTMPPSGVRLADEIRAVGSHQAKHALIPHEAADLEQAVSIARQITPPQGVVLLSPAAPSYGAFKNYEQRGEVFAALVQQG